MLQSTIALFGESEKGDYHIPYHCQNLNQLVDKLGNPPAESRGLFYAVQALLYEHPLIFFRVRDEGFSLNDYWDGLHILETSHFVSQVAAIYMPGLGDVKVMEAFTPLCQTYHSLLITNEKDLYDYLTCQLS